MTWSAVWNVDHRYTLELEIKKIATQLARNEQVDNIILFLCFCSTSQTSRAADHNVVMDADWEQTVERSLGTSSTNPIGQLRSGMGRKESHSVAHYRCFRNTSTTHFTLRQQHSDITVSASVTQGGTSFLFTPGKHKQETCVVGNVCTATAEKLLEPTNHSSNKILAPLHAHKRKNERMPNMHIHTHMQ